MKVITWNLNSRTNKQDLSKQCDYLKNGDFDIITLQEVVVGSEGYIKDYFKGRSVLSSFDLVLDKSLLVNKRKYGQIVISKSEISKIESVATVPFPERVLSCSIQNYEVHTTHVPPGSSNGVIKVEHMEGLYRFLHSRNSEKVILTGDFNSPKQELRTGEVITWGQRLNSKGEVRFSINPKWKSSCSAERWDVAERSIVANSASVNLKDVFRSVHGYGVDAFSWYTNKGVGRRYDHIFCSNCMRVADAFYDQTPRVERVSDHSPLIAEID